MNRAIKNIGLMLCGIIPDEVSDFVKLTVVTLWELLKFILMLSLSIGITLLIGALMLGFVYSIFAAPLIAIAICAVVVTLRVVFR